MNLLLIIKKDDINLNSNFKFYEIETFFEKKIFRDKTHYLIK